MRRSYFLADRFGLNVGEGVAVGKCRAPSGTEDRVLQIPTDICKRDRGTAGFVIFKGPLLYCPINLPEVIDAGVLLRRGASLDEVGDRDGS